MGSLKIITTTRTLDEAGHIEQFCQNYGFSDLILIADGGSIDDTVKIAGQFDNVRVRQFEKRIWFDDGSFMNPEPEHLNFAISWAKEEEADWIILDDSDCWPNSRLRESARSILEETDEQAIHLHRLYVWGKNQYLPKYNVSHALWAWQPRKVNIYWDETEITCFQSRIIGLDPNRARLLNLPYCCLHYFCPSEAVLQRKQARYATWGYPQIHPLTSYGPAEPLPEFYI